MLVLSLARSLAIKTQAALEKVGKLENTVEPESLKKQTAILEQHNVLLSRESKTIAKQAKQDVSVVDDSMAVADAFADAAAYFKSIDSPSEFGACGMRLACGMRACVRVAC